MEPQSLRRQRQRVSCTGLLLVVVVVVDFMSAALEWLLRLFDRFRIRVGLRWGCAHD